MGTEEKVAALAGDEREDLEAINGIGPKWAAALHKMGIRRFEDLAQYTPPDLSQALLEQAGIKIPPERIEANQWIGQARELARHANPGRTPVNKETEEAEDPPQTPPRRKWEQHAAFSVFFDYEIDEHGERIWQTRVYDNESGVEEPLPDIDPALWVNWILERANLPVPVEPDSTQVGAAAPPIPGAPYDAQTEILDVQISVIEPSPDRQPKRLGAEVRFKVSGPEADKLTADRIPFRLEIHTADLESEASNLIVSEGKELEPHVLEYTSQHEFPIPELGRYELRTTVLLLLPGEMMAHHQGPTFRVVP